MKTHYKILINTLFGLAFLLFQSCDVAGQKQTSYELSEEFKNYWYSGNAELTSYKLKQARYGEVHEGHAVLIFVTEDFSKKKQVKLDNPSSVGEDKESVLKLNFTKKFKTGIYPYSIMMSVFSPVDLNNFERPLKVGMTAQEWCGHVFTQMNLDNKKYRVNQFSYFESEGDKEFSLDAGVLTEDEIWNRIRINPESLPVGDLKIIPGLITNRLTHNELEPLNATTQLYSEGGLQHYQIKYDNGQLLTIHFEKEFPHRITGWEESIISSGKKLTTRATLNEQLIIDYWNKNKLEHLYLRDSLGLD